MRILHDSLYVIYNKLVLPVIICLIQKLLGWFYWAEAQPSVYYLPTQQQTERRKLLQNKRREYLTAAWMATLSLGLKYGLRSAAEVEGYGTFHSYN